MQVQVRLAEPFWRVVGDRRISVELADGACVSELLDQLGRQYPDLVREFDEAPPLIFVGDDEGEADTILSEGAHVHLVWPIAGG